MAINEEAHEVRLRWVEGSKDRHPEWIELAGDGFVVKRKRWPFKPGQRHVAWNDVIEVHASIYDCYSCHPMRLHFCFANGREYRVDELMQGYERLLEHVMKAFSGFDKARYDEVEGYFPGEGCQLCWRAK
jgi:hypothetical protein